MNRFYFVLCVVVMVSSCSLIERFRPVQEYDWTLDQESIEVYEDLQVTLNVLGSSVPDVIEWSCEPENFVRYIVSDGGKRCLVQRLEDGECTLVARGGELEKRVQVKVERYSKSGLHLRINGEDMYFPMIKPNYPQKSDVNRYFTVHLNKRDTVEIEVVEWLPKEMESELMVRSVGTSSETYNSEGFCFLYNYPDREIRDQTTFGGIRFPKGEERPFEAVKGSVLKNSVWLFDLTPWEITEGEHKWKEDYEVVVSFGVGFSGGYFGKDKWGDNIDVSFSLKILLREDEPNGIVDFEPVYVGII